MRMSHSWKSEPSAHDWAFPSIVDNEQATLEVCCPSHGTQNTRIGLEPYNLLYNKRLVVWREKSAKNSSSSRTSKPFGDNAKALGANRRARASTLFWSAGWRDAHGKSEESNSIKMARVLLCRLLFQKTRRVIQAPWCDSKRLRGGPFATARPGAESH